MKSQTEQVAVCQWYERRMMGPMDLNYILMAPNNAEILARITAWNKLCRQNESGVKALQLLQ